NEPTFRPCFCSGFSTYEAYWPNIVGCFLMGIVTHHKKFLIERHGLANFHLGLGTALCGCLTTFSSWNEEAALVLVSFDSNPKYSTDNASQVFTWMNIIITGYTTSFMSLLAGFHLASLSPWGNAPSGRIANSVGKRYGCLSSCGKCFKNNELVIAAVCCILATGLVVGLPVGFGLYQLTFEAVLGFFGAVLRYILGKGLNKPQFPFGTYAANILAVLVLCGFYIWQVEENNFPGKPVLNDIITGVTSGFCGSLSTVSTFMNENYGLKRSHAWRYSCASIITAQILAGLILGGYKWAQ
ncbi:hypothetical protein SARC_12391, partial [Sphaeroforma arctica JP610]